MCYYKGVTKCIDTRKEKRLLLCVERLWDLVHAAKQPGMAEREPALIARGAGGGRLRFEQANFPAVMNPWEIRGQAAILLRQCPPSSALDTVALHLDRFADAWTAAWAEHEEPAKAAAAFRALANGAFSEMVKTPGGADIRLANGTQLFKVLMQIVFENATESDRVKASKAAALAAHSDQRLAS